MASAKAVRRPTRAQRQAIRRRRSWAGLAVVLCVTADAWSVASAGAGEPVAEGAIARAARVAMATGTAPSVSVDQVEGVPGAGTDSQVRDPSATATTPGATGSGASSGTKPATAAVPGDGKDDKGAVIESGSGRFTVVAMPASALRPTPTTGKTVRYTVEVEGGVDVKGQDFAQTVGSVLTD